MLYNYRFFLIYLLVFGSLGTQYVFAEELIGGNYTIDGGLVNTISGTLEGDNYILSGDTMVVSGALSGGAYSLNTGFVATSAGTTPAPVPVSSGGGGGGSLPVGLTSLQVIENTSAIVGSCNSVLFSPLNKKSSPASINQLQQALSQFGFYKGVVDGRYNHALVQAITKFQRTHGIKTTIFNRGTFGPRTAKKLSSIVCSQKPGTMTPIARVASTPTSACRDIPSLKKGDRSNDVVLLQQGLKKLGYFLGAVDGYYWTSTIDAVAKFQLVTGIKTNTGNLGLFGPATAAQFNKTICPLVKIKPVTISTRSRVGCVPFRNTLRFGAQNDDVVRLQKFLANELGIPLSITGEYGYETGLAVSQFQQKYFKEVVVRGGLSKPTGMFGAYSLQKANKLIGCYE